MEKNNNQIIKNVIGIVLVIISAVAAVVIAMQATGGDVWYDELYSVEMGKMSYGQIAAFTALDVHPPMYYWYLKTFTGIFHYTDYVSTCKVASFVPYAGMVIIALTMIRKRWGMLTAGLFTLMITVMPNMCTYYVEVRMYSFAMFFSLIEVIMLTDILSKERYKRYKWIILYVSAVIVSYTQYFALVGAWSLYLVIFFLSFRDVENGKQLRKGAVYATIATAIAYLPWVPSMVKQVTEVVGEYWIAPLSIKSIPGCIKYLFLPEYSTIGYVLAVLMIITFAAAYILFAINKDNWDESGIWISGPVALICMVAVGFFFSAIGSPIFIYRYMISSMTVLYLGTAYILARSNRIVRYVAIALIIVAGYKVLCGFYFEETKKITQYEHSKQVLEAIPENSMIVTNFEQVTAATAYYLKDCDAYFYDQFVVDPLLAKLFEDNTYELNGEDIKPYIEDKYDNVYFFGTGLARDDYVADWEQQGVKVTFLDECLIERYWINVYKLELE